MRLKLNCFLIAVYLWFRGRLKGGFGVKRSVGLKGLIPHFFHVKEHGVKELVIVDYIPRTRKSRFTEVGQGDSFVLFEGLYRVRVYKQIGISTSDTLLGAYRGLVYRGRICKKGTPTG